MRRNHGDWGALCLRELEGEEKPGTVARLLAEARGEKPQADEPDELGTATALVKIAELVSAPAAVKQRLADLKKSTETARAAIVEAGRERAGVDKFKADAKAEIAAQRKAHDERIAAEVAAHEARMKAGEGELATKQQKIAAQAKALEAERVTLKAKADALQRHLSEVAA